MGGNTSKKAGNNTKNAVKTKPVERLHKLDGVRQVLLVHHSKTKAQRDAVRHFRDCLIQAAPGSIKVVKTVNVADQTYELQDVSWLDALNNVILIRLTPEDISSLVNVVRQRGYLDENNYLHGRVIAVAFGKSLPSGWPPSGAKRESLDLKDFCLGLGDEEDEFEDSKLSSLVSAIMASQ